MKLEHVGYNVAEPQKLMDWWCANLGFKQVHPAFIVDSTGQMSLEFYNNPAAPVPDWTNMSPLAMHIAFLSDDVVHKPGFDMVMLRDPFGMAIQFVKRGTPILT